MAGKRGARPEVVGRWRERLARWQQLGCSISEFCRREGISQPSFFLWRKRLGSELRPLPARTGRAFLPVEVVAELGAVTAAPGVSTSAASECEFTLGALVCRVPRGLDEAALRRLVRVLREEAARC